LRHVTQFQPEFDQAQPLIVEDVVTKVEWQNPHTFCHVDAKDATGQTVQWVLETGSPNALIMRGWTQKSMKLGDHVLVHGYRAKAGSLADGLYARNPSTNFDRYVAADGVMRPRAFPKSRRRSRSST
jgi:Family of unknown function (DUF6152)